MDVPQQIKSLVEEGDDLKNYIFGDRQERIRAARLNDASLDQELRVASAYDVAYLGEFAVGENVTGLVLDEKGNFRREPWVGSLAARLISLWHLWKLVVSKLRCEKTGNPSPDSSLDASISAPSPVPRPLGESSASF